jgi:hypothetical protein
MRLQTLDLSDNDIGDDGAQALCDHALSKPGCLPALRSLDIEGTSDDMSRRVAALVRSRRPSASARPSSPRRALSPSQIAMRHWRKASKTRRKTIPWRLRQRAPGLADRARLQHMTHRVCDDVLLTGESRAVLGECDGWSSATTSRLRRHGGLSAAEAGRAILGDCASDGVLEKPE